MSKCAKAEEERGRGECSYAGRAERTSSPLWTWGNIASGPPAFQNCYQRRGGGGHFCPDARKSADTVGVCEGLFRSS
eukprot:1972725-Pyramimonas_sp.AAC.1